MSGTRGDAVQLAAVRLVRLMPAAAARALEGRLPAGLVAARGWPHDDTADALRGALVGEVVRSHLVVLGIQVVGDCGDFGGPDDRGGIEIGYGLSPHWRGRGIGCRAVAALVAAEVARPGVRLLVATVDEANVASQRVLGRAGFSLAAPAAPGQRRYELRCAPR